MNDAEFAAWQADCRSDNHQYATGRLAPDEFWNRVAARDTQVAGMSAEERREAKRCMPTTRRGRLVA